MGSRVLLLLIGVVFIVLLFLVFVQFGGMKFLVSKFRGPELFIIDDKCSVIVGQLIHTIQDDGSCRNSCVSECEVRKMEFYESNFILKENNCNKCECYCR